MKLVIIESPFFNKNPKQQEYNVLYARECMKECLYNNEAPYLSHLLYTQVLDDNIIQERNFGIEAGFEFKKVIHHTIVYTDLGISSGMAWGIENAIKQGNTVEYRTLKNFEEFKEKNKKLIDPMYDLPVPNFEFEVVIPKPFLTEKQKFVLLTKSTLNKYSDDHTIEIIYNKLFGNPEYDSFMKLQPEHIQEIKDFLAQNETVSFFGGKLK